jgi:hypothetical protein
VVWSPRELQVRHIESFRQIARIDFSPDKRNTSQQIKIAMGKSNWKIQKGQQRCLEFSEQIRKFRSPLVSHLETKAGEAGDDRLKPNPTP